MTRPRPCLSFEKVGLGGMNGEDATASSRSPRGEPNGRSDVTLGSTWSAAPPHLLRFPTASERR
eukprot:scaffold313_cov378-Pavlova_lutheri.AAC.10